MLELACCDRRHYSTGHPGCESQDARHGRQKQTSVGRGPGETYAPATEAEALALGTLTPATSQARLARVCRVILPVQACLILNTVHVLLCMRGGFRQLQITSTIFVLNAKRVEYLFVTYAVWLSCQA